MPLIKAMKSQKKLQHDFVPNSQISLARNTPHPALGVLCNCSQMFARQGMNTKSYPHYLLLSDTPGDRQRKQNPGGRELNSGHAQASAHGWLIERQQRLFPSMSCQLHLL